MMLKHKPHRAFSILFCMLLLQGGVTGLLINSAGVLFAAIRTDMGFSTGGLSIYYTIRQLTSAFSVSFTSRWFFQCNSKRAMALIGGCCAGSYLVMAFFNQLWQWYIAAAFMGFGMSCCLVVVPIILNNWFSTHRGLIIGLTMASSGLAGAIFNPVCADLIENFGWRVTVAITGVLTLGMTILGSVFLQTTPEAEGLQPFGAHEIPKYAPVLVNGPAHSTQSVPGWVFAAALITLLGGNAYTQFNNQLPVFAQSVGYSLKMGAVLTSVSMLGNILSKLGIGILTDRIGVYRSIKLLLSFILLSQLAFLCGASFLTALMVGAFLYGAVYALGTTAPSLLFLDIYGPVIYPAKVRRMQTINAFVMAFASLLFPYLYDSTGSFVPVFVLGVAICLVSLGLCTWIEMFSKQTQTTSAPKIPVVHIKPAGRV